MEGQREGGREGRREGGREGRREGGKEDGGGEERSKVDSQVTQSCFFSLVSRIQQLRASSPLVSVL